MVDTDTRSLSADPQPEDLSIRLCVHSARLLLRSPSLTDLDEELVRRNEERILVQQPAHDHDRVGPIRSIATVERLSSSRKRRSPEVIVLAST